MNTDQIAAARALCEKAAARLRVCDCTVCPCAVAVTREGTICAGCRSGERCALLNADDGMHRWVDDDGGWSQYRYSCVKCGSVVGSQRECQPSRQGCRPAKRVVAR